MARAEEFRRIAATVLWILVLAAAYYGVGTLGLREQVAVGGVRVTPLWPPTGVSVAALVLLGLRVWPGIALGTLLVVADISSVSPSAFGIIAGNTLAPVVALLLLRRVDFRPELDRFRDGVALVFLGALGAMVISATSASLVLLADGVLPEGEFWSVWSAWWTGDAMGVLTVAPLLLALRYARLPRDTPPLRWVEAAALFLGTVAVTLIATRTSLDLLFLAFPLVMCAALRFQLIGAAPCALAVSVLAVPAATDRLGPFAGHGMLTTMVVLQALNGSAALTGLLLAAIVAERNNTLRSLEDACVGLAEVVARLAPGESIHPWLPTEPEPDRSLDPGPRRD